MNGTGSPGKVKAFSAIVKAFKENFKNDTEQGSKDRLAIGLPAPKYLGLYIEYKNLDKVRTDQNPLYKPLVTKLFYSILVQYHKQDPTPQIPDGKPPDGLQQQFKISPSVSWSLLCKDLQDLLDELDYGGIFSTPPQWVIDYAKKPQPSFQSPKNEKEELWNLMKDLEEDLKFPESNDKWETNRNYKNLMDLLRDLIKRFCPPPDELPASLAPFVSSTFGSEVAEDFLETKWIIYDGFIISRTPFYNPR